MRTLALAWICFLLFSGQAFSDASPKVLTLPECIQIAVTRATTVLQQTNQYDLTAAAVLRGYGQFLPNLSVGANYGYESGSTLYSIQGQALVTERGLNAGIILTSTLNLFNGLSDLAGLKSSLAKRDASGLSLGFAKQQIALDIIQTYLQLVLDGDLLDDAKKNLEASEARLRLLQGQAKVGSASVADLYQQEAQTSADSFNLSSYEARIQNDQTLLVRKLRIDPGQIYRFERPAFQPPQPVVGGDLDHLVSNALGARLDVQANSSLAESSQWDVKSARGAYLPRLDLVFERNAAGTYLASQSVNGVDTLTFTQPGLGSQLGNQVEYSVSLNLTWNIFDRFATRFNVAQAQTLSENTEIAFDDSKLQVQADVRIAYTNLQSAEKQLETAKVGLEAAQKSYEAVEGRYEVGASSLVDVLTAQATLFQARSNRAQGIVNLELQKKTLDYALGRLET